MKQQNSKSTINERTRVFIQEKTGIDISLEEAEEISNSFIQYSQVLLEIAKEQGLLYAHIDISKKERDGN